MTCNFDEMLLYEYLDNLLEPKEKMLVNNHLSVCASCRKKISEIKLLFYEIEHLPELEIPTELSTVRSAVVADAFSDKSSTYQTMKTQLIKAKNVLEEAPLIGTLFPNKNNLSAASKALYSSSKKIVQKLPKKEKPKMRSLLKNLGDLL